MLLVPPQGAWNTRPLYHIFASLNIFNPSSGVTTVRRGGHSDGEFVGDFECACSFSSVYLTNERQMGNDAWNACCHSWDRAARDKERDEVQTIWKGHRRESRDPDCYRVPSKSLQAEFLWKWDEDRSRMLYWVSDEHLAKVRPVLRVQPILLIDVQYYVAPNGARSWSPNSKVNFPIAIFFGRSLEPRADKRRQPLSALKVFPRAHDGALLDHIVLGALILERRRLSP
jgi:hypothetical protein